MHLRPLSHPPTVLIMKKHPDLTTRLFLRPASSRMGSVGCRLLLLLPVFLLSACGNDGEPTGPDYSSANRNANTQMPQTYYTEPQTSSAVRARAPHGIEIPRLRNSVSDAFVAHVASGTKGDTLNYCIEYDRTLRTARWTAFKLYNGFSSNNTAWSRNRWRSGETFNGYGGDYDPFQPDPCIPVGERLELDDYVSSGYQRGHMLASADRLNSKVTNGQTFYLSNMHPQLKTFNESGGTWYNLEGFLRDRDKSTLRDTLYVVKGGTVSEGNYRMEGKNRNLVCPKYFYMAILCYSQKYARINGGYTAIAFWAEHANTTYGVSARLAISIDELERRTGIDFFCNLPDEIEDAVEKAFYPDDWNLK